MLLLNKTVKTVQYPTCISFIENKNISKKTIFEVCDGFLDYKITEVLLKYLKINNQIFTNYLIGISNNEFNINGSDVLLNYKLMEDICIKKYLLI